MTVKKKIAARQAADLYPIDHHKAVEEYAKTTGQYSVEISKEESLRLQKELLSLLPPYRHPMFDEFGE